ncbi:tail fiber domain-containing protein [Salmonella enterica subsp. enterica serovar Mississippi]|nr:tail fiber domain-containing protein [Salmonella enterica subsp. enterica serovar Mississippi]
MPIDDRTPRFDLELPAQSNTLRNDVQRLRSSFDKLSTKAAEIDPATNKLLDAHVPDDIPRLDANGKLKPQYVNAAAVASLDADGKVDYDAIPDDAKMNIFDATTEVTMLDVVDAQGNPPTIGDVCNITTAPYRQYLMVKKNPKQRDSWRELPMQAINTVNGQSIPDDGAIVVAAAGVNNDITSLTALSGPLKLGGDAAGEFDAVTLRQLKANSGGAAGANMSGVMNNFIGAVEWFNGTRAALPAGYIPADGQKVSRTDPSTADLWAAVKAGMFNKVTDALWIDSGDAARPTAWRSSYSEGDGSTNFRVPDLNGMGANSIKHLFLSGSSGSPSEPSVGQVWVQAAPNITGQISSIASDYTIGTFIRGSGAFDVPSTNENRIINPQVQGGSASANAQLNANRVNRTYGRGSQYQKSTGGAATQDSPENIGDLFPNHAVGIWIIRANGAFQAANTKFQIIAADALSPTDGFNVRGGVLSSEYNIGTTPESFASFSVTKSIGSTTSTAQIYVSDKSGENQTFSFDSKGNLGAGGEIWAGGAFRANKYPTGAIKNTAGGSLQSRIMSGTQERSAFGLFTSIGGDVNESRFGNLALTVDGQPARTSTWQFNNSGEFHSPSAIHVTNGSYYAAVNFNPLTAKNGGQVANGDTITGAGIWLNGLQNGNQRFQSGLYSEIVWGSFARTMIAVSDSDPGYGTKYWFFYATGELAGPAGTINNGGSDQKLKRDIEDAPAGAADRIAQVRPRDFTWKNTGRADRGWIAQELEAIDPVYVFETECDPKTKETIKNVSDRAIIADLIATVQGLMNRVAELEVKLNNQVTEG